MSVPFLSPPTLAMTARLSKFVDYITREVEAGKIESLEDLRDNFERYVEDSMLQTHGAISKRYQQPAAKFIALVKAEIDRSGEKIFKASNRQKLKLENEDLNAELKNLKSDYEDLNMWVSQDLWGG